METEANAERKREALRNACNDIEGVFFRSFIIADDGKLDIVADDEQDSPIWEIEGLRPGLWRSSVRFEEGMSDTAALWAIWVWDGTSEDLLKQKIKEQEIADEMRAAIKARTGQNNINALDWQGQEGCPGGECGIALRSRHVLSSEFYNFIHGTTVILQGETVKERWDKLPEPWRRELGESFNCSDALGGFHDECNGVTVGGAVMGTESMGYRPSFAINDQGQIFGLLLGDLPEQSAEEDQEYDLVQYEEALQGAPQDVSLHPTTVTCIHDGDPHFEGETPNYLPPFQIVLRVEDLLADTSASASAYIEEHLMRNQHQLFNPYLDASHMFDCKCRPKIDSDIPLAITFDAAPSFWANLRSNASPASASLQFHLPRLHHVLEMMTASMVSRRTSSTTEWTAPDDWCQPTRPSICPPDQYRLEPVFRYVGCGYALTPNSTYPPLKASSIWRWVAEAVDRQDRDYEAFSDPYRMLYELGHPAKDAVEVLGQTAIIVSVDGDHHFADIFAIDQSRGLLFGWLRTSRHVDTFCAFALPSSRQSNVTESDIDSTLPPFKEIQVEKFGLPRLIPLPSLPKSLHVPLICRQQPNPDSPNLVPEIVIQVPCDLGDNQHAFMVTVVRLVCFGLLNGRSLHPLYLQALKEIMKKPPPFPIVGYKASDSRLTVALDACIRRGQIPADFGLTASWAFMPHASPERSQLIRDLPVPRLRQQPRESAWIAPSDWFEPRKPTVDPNGEYEAVDVMSYVGCGYVLSPSSTYPPSKAKFVWSRVSFGEDPLDSGIFSTKRAQQAKSWIPPTLLDVLGQTAMVHSAGGRSIIFADIFGVDESRGLVFGFSRMEKRDTFVCCRLKGYSTTSSDQASSDVPNPGIEPIEIYKISIPILNVDV